MASKDMNSYSYAEDILKEMQALYHRQALCDITLATEDGAEFKTHRALLASSSRYFASVLEIQGAENHNDQYVLRNIDSTSLESLLEFLYSGHLQLTGVNASSLLSAASQLQIKHAIDLCQIFLVDNLGDMKGMFTEQPLQELATVETPVAFECIPDEPPPLLAIKTEMPEPVMIESGTMVMETDTMNFPLSQPPSPLKTVTPYTRRRGRPPKVKPAQTEETEPDPVDLITPLKIVVSKGQAPDTLSETAETPKPKARGRGRPRKIQPLSAIAQVKLEPGLSFERPKSVPKPRITGRKQTSPKKKKVPTATLR